VNVNLFNFRKKNYREQNQNLLILDRLTKCLIPLKITLIIKCN